MEEKETTQLSVSEQEIQIQPPSLLDKLKIHKWKILGGILGVLVFAGAVFGAYKLGQRKIQPASQPTLTPVVVATPTPDPTADWKTYTNTKYGYSIKYPVDWNTKVKCEGGIPEDDYICFLSPNFEESPAGAVMGSTTKGGLIWMDGKGDLVGSPIDKFCTLNTDSDCKEITIDNLRAMQRTWTNNTTTQVGIVKNNEFVASLRVTYNNESRTEILNIFNLMLSTFKFLE